jgi:bifunctional non-homologous end joining protein LigD
MRVLAANKARAGTTPLTASLKVKGAVWVTPELQAQVAYRGFTTAGELRHASFKGLRDDE